MSQTLKQRMILDHVKPSGRAPKDTYYQELAEGFLALLCVLFVVGLAWAVYTGFESVFAMFVVVAFIGLIIVLSVLHVADLFVERNEN